MKLKYINLILVAASICVLCANVYSGPRTKLGTLSAPELLIPLGSLGTSMNGSNISNASGVDAMYWNPAGITQLKSPSGEAMFSYMHYFADMSMQYVAGAFKLGNIGVLGASIRNLSFGEPIQVTTEYQPEGTGEEIHPVYLTANLSLARAMTDKVMFGTNVKLINEKIGNVSAIGYAFDFGLQYLAGKSGLKFGIAIKNLGPSLKFDGPGLDRSFIENGIPVVRRVNLQEFELPTSLEIGVSYTGTFSKKNTISIAGAFMNNGLTSDEYKGGLEYSYNNYVFLRGGFTYYPDKEKDESVFGPTFGAGVKYPFGNLMVGFDYAYRLINKDTGLNSTNQFFTLSIGF